ncbi:MAG: tetratricopeptide repeat protein, partial [Syntrophaceae bacterium]|nr:tetratricopeptide repeat protein [Syntrophaceae bacterium]
IMMLLDYWPLNRFQSQKSNWFLWQIKEKWPLFVLSLLLVLITFYTPGSNVSYQFLPLDVRLANAPVAFVTYLIKTFWPQGMAVFYPFPSHIPTWQVLGATFLIIVISVFVILRIRRLPHLFAGWFWFVITIALVIGIIQIGEFSMADRYHYLPSIGIAIMLAWGTTSLFSHENIRKNILFPAAITLLIMMSVLSWKQCGCWKNSFSLFGHAVQVTQNNFLAHTSLGLALHEKGYIGEAIEHYNTAIRLKPNYDKAHNNRGIAYFNLGQYQLAIEDFNAAIRLHPVFADYYNNRGFTYDKLGQYQLAIEDYHIAIHMHPAFAKYHYNRGCTYGKIGQYDLAFEDCNEAIRLEQNFAGAYMCRGSAYLKQGNKTLGCRDAQTACELGACGLFEVVKSKEICR